MKNKLLTSFVLAAGLCSAAPISIRLATLAPAGTSLHQALQVMRQKWLQASNGEVQLTLFTNGTMGDEAQMVQRMRVGQLHAAMVTVVGLSDIDRSVTALQYMPMMFRSLDEVDFVREQLRARLEQKLLDKGFVVLFWAD